LFNIKRIAAPVSEAGRAATTTDEQVVVSKSTPKKLLYLPSQKSNKNWKNKIYKKKSIAELVINLETESKATQRAMAVLKEILFEFTRTHTDDLARTRERLF
jgi:hypothetical protein